jgi:hypothetical protein
LTFSVGAPAAFVLNTSGATKNDGAVKNGELNVRSESGAHHSNIPDSTAWSFSNGWVGATVDWHGAAPTGGWSFEYLGKEASWNNLFQFTDGKGGWNTVFANKDYPRGAETASAIQEGISKYSPVGDFGFRFVTDADSSNNPKGSSQYVTNVSNSVNYPSFFATIDKGSLVLWLDDSGNTVDRDFSDMGIRISAVSAVPIPAAGWLFGSGLVGLAMVARRRRSARVL